MLETIFDKKFGILGLGTTRNSENKEKISGGVPLFRSTIIPKILIRRKLPKTNINVTNAGNDFIKTEF